MRTEGSDMKFLRVVLSVIAIGVVASPLRAEFISISTPEGPYPSGGSYVSSTTLIPVMTPEFGTTSIISSGGLTVTSSIPLQVLKVDTSWGSWSDVPFSEGAFPTVLYTQGPSQVALTFSQPLRTFGFELEPNQLGPFNFTAAFRNGTTTVGSITRNVDGDAGALLFAGVSTGPSLPFTNVLISGGGQDFAIAQPRFVTAAAPPVTPVPGPASGVLFLLGGMLALGSRQLNRRFAQRPMQDGRSR